MATRSYRLVVVGHGGAGLAAALTAAQEARRSGLRVAISVLEKADEQAAGGNTRWSPAYMRLASPDRLDPGFESELLQASNGRGDAAYFRSLAENATATVAWLCGQGLEFCSPVYYLSVGPARIQPIGGGAAIVRELSRAAKGLGVEIHYRCRATRLLIGESGQAAGVVAAAAGGTHTFPADAVILATGGFQADAEMMRGHFGPLGEQMRLISPGTRYNSGDGIRMAMERGALVSGDWSGMHAEPIDPRSRESAAVVLVYPYGIVVDRLGRRFVDEGAGPLHETWEKLAKKIQFETPSAEAYAILDSRLFAIDGFERAIRSEVPPYRADSIEGLAVALGLDPSALAQTVAHYNLAANKEDGGFDPTRCDGLAAAGALSPPKSNWARAITVPPFIAYPLAGAVAYTFGGLATSVRAEVLTATGRIPGLYAAGETTGHFYGTAPNAVALLRALVFGRIAGAQAISHFESSSR